MASRDVFVDTSGLYAHYSFIDCSSFVAMRELRLRQALTTDGLFPEAGYEALLPVG